jgi:regulator of protease activity HflC (stomatin/prohibitin superfamily)
MDIGYFKGQPTHYIIKFVAGRVTREGMGLSFFYLKHNTSIVAVPTSSTDASFVFNELTSNFQAVTLQGQFTYHIANARQAATLLNFTLDPARRTYISNDPDLLAQRLTNVIQMETRTEIQQRSLEETLRDSQAIAAVVLARIREKALVEPMGVELLNVYFLSARPTPEVAKALEAKYRETLLRKADEAIYRRRAAAVEEERKIKENELNSDTTLEQQRQQLIELQGNNAQQEAEHRGRALEREAEYRSRAMEMELGAYRSLEPGTILALALKELGENANKIGTLTITSEILAALLNGQPPPRQGR